MADETRLIRYNWDEQNLKATIDKVLFNLPAGGRHFTRSLIFDKNGKLYVSIGSTCDACRESHLWLAAVIMTDADGNNPAVFASGLRNSVFLAVNPVTGEVWATEMGRDNLGDDFPPDEINILRQGKDYGWPQELNPEPPIYKIQAHSAPLGLVFTPDGNLLVAYHGSWNRTVPVGYKIVKLTVNGNSITGEEDFLTGGRPVDVIFDKAGNLFYSDDREGVVYKIGA